MPYDRLLKTNRIKAHPVNRTEIKQLLQLAQRDVAAAQRNLPDAPDWAYSIAYNSALQASRALMFHEGFRPRGGEQHAAVVDLSKNVWDLLIQATCGCLTRCGENATGQFMRWLG